MTFCSKVYIFKLEVDIKVSCTVNWGLHTKKKIEIN